MSFQPRENSAVLVQQSTTAVYMHMNVYSVWRFQTQNCSECYTADGPIGKLQGTYAPREPSRHGGRVTLDPVQANG